MGRKTTLWLFQMMNWQDCKREDMDMATKSQKSY